MQIISAAPGQRLSGSCQRTLSRVVVCVLSPQAGPSRARGDAARARHSIRPSMQDGVLPRRPARGLRPAEQSSEQRVGRERNHEYNLPYPCSSTHPMVGPNWERTLRHQAFTPAWGEGVCDCVGLTGTAGRTLHPTWMIAPVFFRALSSLVAASPSCDRSIGASSMSNPKS